jgi:hypothetical protein
VAAAIERAKSGYEHALTRAAQIGLSEGVRLSLWDLGTGMGSAEAADAAFQDGQEDFAFAERSALPATAYDKVQQANANVAEQKSKLDLAASASRTGVHSDNNIMRMAGMTDAQIATNKREIQQSDLPADPAVTQDFTRANGKARAR